MTSTIPRLPRAPLAAPPNAPLPALPVAKTRTRSVDPLDSPVTHSRRSSTASQLPPPSSTRKLASPTRSVTTSGLPTPRGPSKTVSSPSVPTLNTTDLPTTSPSSPAPASALPKTIRKTSSIGSFPLPPKNAAAAATRITSLPPSPLSTSTTSNDAAAAQAQRSSRRESSKTRSEAGGRKSRSSRSSGYGVARPRTSGAGLVYSPSLLNGPVESNFISAGETTPKQHDSLLSLPSPPQSRSSSANGTYPAVGDDAGDVEQSTRGRQRSGDNSAAAAARRESPGVKDMKGNVLVSVRVRPDSGAGDDDASAADGEWLVDGRRSLISFKGKEGGDYRYDNVFSPHDNNSRVYDNAAKRLVRRVMEGYHGTVFAYGMTGTGKTFSMQGTSSAPGVIPLAITDIFSYIRENPNREFLLRVSYLEIYNERIYDLLSQSTPGQTQQEEIKLREDSKRGVYATPLKEEIVQSPNQLLRVIARGDAARRVGSTQFNARSSRSHAVVQIVVESRERTPSNGAYFDKEARRTDRILPGGVLVSTLSLIDLAGSEKAAENKERRTEGAHINKSLLTLGTVIGKLALDVDDGGPDGKKDGEGGKEKSVKHLPYRDSKLTRLLQPALSGNSLVSILCTVQLSSTGTSAANTSSHTGETLNTLKFASRAKNNIVSHAKKNESANANDPGSRALLDRYRLEIQELRAQLDKQSKAKDDSPSTPSPPDEFEQDRQREAELEKEENIRHEEQMLEMQLARTALKERISHLNRLILSSKSLGVNSGRFSSNSLIGTGAGVNSRLSTYSLMTDVGRPVSNASELYDGNHLQQRNSLASPDDAEGAHAKDFSPRAVSAGSIAMGTMAAAAMDQMVVTEDSPTLGDGVGGGDEDPADVDVDVDGDHASLAQQNRMLQADLADKNRYIATLEKRLLQARRTSHSRVSMQFAARVGLPEEPSLEGLLRDRDREIDELRAKLDDQMRMVTALRSAARKREMLDSRRSHMAGGSVAGGDDENSPRTARNSAAMSANGDAAAGTDSVPDLASLQWRRHNSASNRTSAQSLRLRNSSAAGHRSNGSTASRTSTGGLVGAAVTTAGSTGAAGTTVNFSKTPLGPMEILSRPSSAGSASGVLLGGGAGGAEDPKSPGRLPGKSRRKSVDEMTMLLDQMIQDKVESGNLVRGERGSLRVRHDTVLLQGLEDAHPGSHNNHNHNHHHSLHQQQADDFPLASPTLGNSAQFPGSSPLRMSGAAATIPEEDEMSNAGGGGTSVTSVAATSAPVPQQIQPADIKRAFEAAAAPNVLHPTWE